MLDPTTATGMRLVTLGMLSFISNGQHDHSHHRRQYRYHDARQPLERPSDRHEACAHGVHRRSALAWGAECLKYKKQLAKAPSRLEDGGDEAANVVAVAHR